MSTFDASSTQVTRRSFVTRAGVALAGATAIAGSAGTVALAAETKAPTFDETYDVVVIGYGAAGGTAAFYAADWNRIPGFDPTGSVCARFARELARSGLRQAGPVFAPDVLPVCGRVYATICLPVEAATLRGRAALARLR